MQHPRHPLRRPAVGILLATALLATACATTVSGLPRLVAYGEQHDQPDHQRQVAEAVKRSAANGTLAAVVIEMADRGRSTVGLPRDADDTRVQAALGWQGWPWDSYREVVMNAVGAGVPVLGGNLPRASMRGAMADTTLEARVPDTARQALSDAVRDGHCGLLPESQLPGMVRVQIARDRSIAATLDEAVRDAPADRQVLLLAGGQHVARDRGVPLHLTAVPAREVHVVLFSGPNDDVAAGLAADERRPATLTPRPDPCEGLKERLKPGGAGPTAPSGG